MRYPSAEKSHSFPGYLLLKYSLTESTVLELWQDGQAARNGGNRTADELDHFGRPSEVAPCLYPARTTLIRTSAIVLHFASANTPNSSL